jgi:hypothetical protein
MAPTSKNVTMPSLKPIQKNRKDDMKFTFDLAKCDRIFDELLRNEYIKLSHALPSSEELKRRAWCKWHNSRSHPLMIVKSFVDRSNRLSMRDD